MAVEPDPYEHVAMELCADPEVRETRMMGMRSLKCGGRLFCGEWEGELVVKLGCERVAELIASARARPFDPTGRGRPMAEWALVPAPAEDWIELAVEARAALG